MNIYIITSIWYRIVPEELQRYHPIIISIPIITDRSGRVEIGGFNMRR